MKLVDDNDFQEFLSRIKELEALKLSHMINDGIIDKMIFETTRAYMRENKKPRDRKLEKQMKKNKKITKKR